MITRLNNRVHGKLHVALLPGSGYSHNYGDCLGWSAAPPLHSYEFYSSCSISSEIADSYLCVVINNQLGPVTATVDPSSGMDSCSYLFCYCKPARVQRRENAETKQTKQKIVVFRVP